MKKIKRYLKIILGCLIISLTLNMLFKGSELVPSGLFGFAILYMNKTSMNLALIVLLANIFFFVFGYLILNYRELKKMILPFLLVPALIFLTSPLTNIIDIGEIDPLLLSLYSGVFMGIGYNLIYKEGYFASGTDVIMLVTRRITHTRIYLPNYLIDVLWIIIGIHSYGFEGAMYSLLSIIIMEVLSKRARVGVSDSKVFYIITKKEKEVREFILDELNRDLTSFDTKGGFLKSRNRVLMCVISTKEYYKLKEGIREIDPHAFISITDSYEVINPNRHIEER